MWLHVTPSNFFSRIVTREVLVNSFFLFQNNRFTEKLLDLTLILIQTL